MESRTQMKALQDTNGILKKLYNYFISYEPDLHSYDIEIVNNLLNNLGSEYEDLKALGKAWKDADEEINKALENIRTMGYEKVNLANDVFDAATKRLREAILDSARHLIS